MCFKVVKNNLSASLSGSCWHTPCNINPILSQGAISSWLHYMLVLVKLLPIKSHNKLFFIHVRILIWHSSVSFWWKSIMWSKIFQVCAFTNSISLGVDWGSDYDSCMVLPWIYFCLPLYYVLASCKGIWMCVWCQKYHAVYPYKIGVIGKYWSILWVY